MSVEQRRRPSVGVYAAIWGWPSQSQP